MPYAEAQIAAVALGAGGATAPWENRLTACQQVMGEGLSSAASTITLEGAPTADGTYVTTGTASPGAGGFFRITGTSGARFLRLKSSAASTLTNVTIAAHD